MSEKIHYVFLILFLKYYIQKCGCNVPTEVQDSFVNHFTLVLHELSFNFY